MTFDMGAAWSEGLARVGANLSLLAVLGGVFFFVPAVIMYIAMPELMDMMMMPGGDPEAMTRMLEASLPRLTAIYTLVMIASFIGYTAMIALIGDRGRLSVGEAIGVGFKALLPLIGVLLIGVVAYVLFALIVGLLLGLVVGGLAAISQGLAYGVAVLVGIALFIGIMLVLTRVSMTMAVIALERVVNPITALRRSWAMTGPVQWRLLGFYVLFFAAYMVLALVLFMVLGLILAAVGSPAAFGFLNGLIGAAAAIVISGLVVGIYRQLTASAPATVSETFS